MKYPLEKNINPSTLNKKFDYDKTKYKDNYIKCSLISRLKNSSISKRIIDNKPLYYFLVPQKDKKDNKNVLFTTETEEKAKNSTQYIIIAKDNINKDGDSKHYQLFDYDDDIFYCKDNYHLYENLHNNLNLKPLLDIDHTVKDPIKALEYETEQAKGNLPIKEDIDILINNLINKVESLHNIKIDYNDVFIFESCGRSSLNSNYKISYHIALPVIIKFTELKNFALQFEDEFIEFRNKFNDPNIIDPRIYNKKDNQLLRLPHQSKKKCKNGATIKRIVQPTGLKPIDYFIGIYGNQANSKYPVLQSLSEYEIIKNDTKEIIRELNKVYHNNITLPVDINNKHKIAACILSIPNHKKILNYPRWAKIIIYTFYILGTISKEDFEDYQNLDNHIDYNNRFEYFKELFLIWTYNAYNTYSDYDSLKKAELRKLCKKAGVKKYEILTCADMINELEKIRPTDRSDNDINKHIETIDKVYQYTMNNLKEFNNKEGLNPFAKLIYIASLYNKNLNSEWREFNTLPKLIINKESFPDIIDFQPFPEFGDSLNLNKKFNMLWAGCGSNKTGLIIDKIKSDNNLSALFIVGNQNLALSICNRINRELKNQEDLKFKYYSDGNNYDNKRLVCTIHSLQNITYSGYDLIILDEAVETLGALYNRTTETTNSDMLKDGIDKRAEILHKLNIFFQNSQYVIFADALYQTARTTVTFISEFVKIYNERIDCFYKPENRLKQKIILKAHIKKYTKKYNVDEYNIVTLGVEEIIKHLKEGLNVFGNVLFRRHEKYIRERFKREGFLEGKDYIFIHKYNKDDPNIKKYIIDPSLIAKDNIKCFLHTLTIQTGFSEETPDYWNKKIFIYEEFGTLDSSNFTFNMLCQAMQRCRYSKEDEEGYQTTYLYYKQNPDFKHRFKVEFNEIKKDEHEKALKYPSNLQMTENIKRLYEYVKLLHIQRNNIYKHKFIESFEYIILEHFSPDFKFIRPDDLIKNHKELYEYMTNNNDVNKISQVVQDIQTPIISSNIPLSSHPIYSEIIKNILFENYENSLYSFNSEYCKFINDIKDSDTQKNTNLIYIYLKYFLDIEYTHSKCSHILLLFEKKLINELIEFDKFEKFFNTKFKNPEWSPLSSLIIFHSNPEKYNIIKFLINLDESNIIYKVLYNILVELVEILRILDIDLTNPTQKQSYGALRFARRASGGAFPTITDIKDGKKFFCINTDKLDEIFKDLVQYFNLTPRSYRRCNKPISKLNFILERLFYCSIEYIENRKDATINNKRIKYNDYTLKIEPDILEIIKAFNVKACKKAEVEPVNFVYEEEEEEEEEEGGDIPYDDEEIKENKGVCTFFQKV